MLRLIRQGAVDLLEPESRGLRVDLRLVQRNAVTLDRVTLTLERRRQGLDGFLRGAAEHRRQVGAHPDQVVRLRGQVVHRCAAVFQLRNDERPELVELVRSQADVLRRTLRPLVHLLGGLAEHRVDLTDRLLQIARVTNSALEERTSDRSPSEGREGADLEAGARRPLRPRGRGTTPTQIEGMVRERRDERKSGPPAALSRRADRGVALVSLSSLSAHESDVS